MLSVRIVTSDHSMDDPIPGLDVTYSSFRGSVVKKVPVIRIFGPDSTGLKTCLHIHGVFPYIFIPCEESEPDGKTQYQIASSLDLALNISLGQTSSLTQHVFKVVLVSGTPFYGYHQTSHQFYKIFFYNPGMVKKAAELLQSGAILNKVYQVHDGHVPYNLQFFIDYNLRGMDYISLESVKYRRFPANGHTTTNWDSAEFLLPEHIPRLSVSEVEADGLAGDILNIRTMSLEMNPGLADIWDDEKQRRRSEYRSSQITPQSSQERPACSPTESEIFYKNRLQENLRVLNTHHQDNSPSSMSMDYSGNINNSVPYPAEVPAGSSLMNASHLDSHLVSSSSLPKNSPQGNLNESFVDESLVLSLLSASQKRSQNDSVVLNSQDMMFADVLGELQEDNVRVDDDSVLGTQLQKDGPDDETDFLGLNHELVNTILEKNVQINSDETATKETRQMWQESFWSGVDPASVIPQLDGNLDSPDSTPGTSTSETQPVLDLAQPGPNYWPAFPELAALEPCDDNIQNPTNGSGEQCEEDLIDLSFSTASYSNISEPYSRVLMGDPSFTLPPSATSSELGDFVPASNEFVNSDPHFEGELMENLNFPDIGDLLEPALTYSPVKVDPRMLYAVEMNGSAPKVVMAKDNSKRKHSKARKPTQMSHRPNGALVGPSTEYAGAGAPDGVFQHPQLPVPFTNAGHYYQPFPPSSPVESEAVVKPTAAKKVSAKRKSCSLPPSSGATENEIQLFQNDIDTAAGHVKKVSGKRKSISSQPCMDMSCYEGAINNAVIWAIGEHEDANSNFSAENSVPVCQYGDSSTDIGSPVANFADTNPIGNFADTNPIGNFAEAHPNTNFEEAHPNANFAEAHPNTNFEEAHPNTNFAEANPNTNFAVANPNANFAEAHPNANFVGAHSIANFAKPHPNANFAEAHPNANFVGAHSIANFAEPHPNSNFAEAHPIIAEEPVNITSNFSKYEVSINDAVIRRINEPGNLGLSLASGNMDIVHQQTDSNMPKPVSSSSSVVVGPNITYVSAQQVTNTIQPTKAVYVNPSSIGVRQNPSSIGIRQNPNSIGIRQALPPHPRQPRTQMPKNYNLATNSFPRVLHNKLLPSISITAVKRKNTLVPEQNITRDPSVIRTKSLPAISLTVNKKRVSAPSGTNTNTSIKCTPDAYSLVPVGNRKENSMPKAAAMRVAGSSLKSLPVTDQRNSEGHLRPATKVEREEMLRNHQVSANELGRQKICKKVYSMQDCNEIQSKQLTSEKTESSSSGNVSLLTEAKVHGRSPLALVRREDDLTLAQLMKLEKIKEKSSPLAEAVPSSSNNCAKPQAFNPETEYFEIALSKTTLLTTVKNSSTEPLENNCLPEEVGSLDEHSIMTINDTTDTRSGAGSFLRVNKNSTDNLSLADMLNMVTEIYNNPNPSKFTFFKDMGGPKFRFETAEVCTRNISNDATKPPPSSPSSSHVLQCSLPKPNIPCEPPIVKNKRKRTAASKKQKMSLTAASREITDARLIALYEARTGQTINRTARVTITKLGGTNKIKHPRKKAPKQFKIPSVDGGVNSDSSSSTDDGIPTSQPQTPKRRKGRYRPLAVHFEKSPKSEPNKSCSAGNSGSRRRKRPKRGSYGALDIKFDTSPSAVRQSQSCAASSSLGIRPNACNQTATFPPDATVDRLSSDSLETTSCVLSKSKCDQTNISVQSETGCDQDNFLVEAARKTAKKKLSFLSLSSNRGKDSTNFASNSSEVDAIGPLPARRSSFDIFQESESPLMFPSSGDVASDSPAQSPLDIVESIGDLEFISDDDINDLGIVSFYDNTHVFKSPSDSSFHGSPESSDIVSSLEMSLMSPKAIKECSNKNFEDIVDKKTSTEGNASTSYQESTFQHQHPFYSDPADVTAGIHVGQRIIKLLHGPSLQPKDNRPQSPWQGNITITPCQLPPSYAEVARWEKARKLLKAQEADKPSQKKVDESNLPSSQSVAEESESEVSIPLASQSPPTPPIKISDTSNATSTPQISRRKKMTSPIYTPIIDVKAKLRSSKRKSIVIQSFKPQEPSIEEADERSASSKSSPPSLAANVPSTSKETPKRLRERRRSSLNSNEEQSLHKLLLQSQFRQQLASPRRLSSGCQIEGVQNGTFGFGMSLGNLQDVKAVARHQFLSVLAVEVHVQTRGDLRPDPAHDPVRAIFYHLVNDVPDGSATPKLETGVLAVNEPTADGADFLAGCGVAGRVLCAPSERRLLADLVELVGRTDPDIFCGYETEMQSWGYLIQRAATLHINLCPLLSRVPTAHRDARSRAEEADAAAEEPTDIRLPGRIVLNVWRLMKSEIALINYSFENVMFHVVHQRVPLHSFRSLSQWWEHRSKHYRWLTAEYYALRVAGIIRMLDQLDLIGRTCELARLFGIQFYEVFSRGSQFRVESMMLRLAKPLNFVPVSPSIHQRAKMRAPECVPLILEPESAFYADPVIVLDFQSLYPSIIIAYNYCFSTCLGRVEHLGKREPFDFGCTSLKVPPKLVGKLLHKTNISPNGVAFVSGGVRRGVLPRMLQEILDTRLMVKRSMKEHKDDKTLQRVLHSRQLGLKLIANVTYGYTAANFSGRMPCAEVADSVVSKGRETLERAIRLVQETERWGAKVVYGDTDSLFVMVKGRSREQAFAIGAEIAEAVTQDNPKPVKLKLEKVYHPCILQTKKRYVGFLYESPEQSEPKYDAKGIETVRRDGCPAVAKMLEKTLRLLFESRDVSLVKRYVCRQLDKLMRGRANMQDLVFAREYRGMAGYKPGACVPALELTRRWLRTDKRAEPRVGERVPYVVVTGAPGLPLIRLVRSPHDLLAEPGLRINAAYYIGRAIAPALNRCLLLIGADVHAWFAAMPRKTWSYLPTTTAPAAAAAAKKMTISQYFATTDCAVCARPTATGVCGECRARPQTTVLALTDKVRVWERGHARITQVCESCVGRTYATDCQSLDCPVMFRKYQAFRDLEQAPFVRQLIDQYSF